MASFTVTCLCLAGLISNGSSSEITVKVKWPHLLVELGVEKRSITGAKLTVPTVVKTGDESVVAVAGFL